MPSTLTCDAVTDELALFLDKEEHIEAHTSNFDVKYSGDWGQYSYAELA